jgi:HAE1 family hydrophobic/amphiphilic exporter-1
MKISDFAVDHPVPVTIIVAVIAVFGIMAAMVLTQTMFPDFTQPTINVAVTYPGVSPEEIERQVTSVIEEELSKLSDVKNISSRSLPSRASVNIELDWSVDVDKKLVDVRERLNSVSSKLPDGISGEPVITKMNPNELPVLTVGLEGGMDLAATTRYAEDQIIPRIATIPGVSGVTLVGKQDRCLEVRLDPDRMMSLGISPLEVVQALSASNSTVPAGRAEYGAMKVNLTSEAKFTDPVQAENVVVGFRGGTPVRVGDVASVAVGEKESNRQVLVNGERNVLIDVMAQNGADTVKIIKETKRRLAEDSATTEGFSYSYYRDQSSWISDAIRSVRDSAVQGGILAVVVLYLFLGSIGPTLIIALSIPFTILVAFTALYLNGHTLNTMTLGGLTVAVGMIVDASIVMLESIWKRVSSGERGSLAAKKSAAEMGGAIIASTLTSIVVFAPLIFVTGITGIVVRDVAFTIIYALTGSVIAAVFIVPFLSAFIFGAGKRKSAVPDATRRGPAALIQRGITALEEGYARILDRVLGHAVFLILASIAVLVLSISLLNTVGFEFIPDTDSREIIVELDVPKSYGIERILQATREADRLITELVPEAESRVFYVGQSAAWSASPTIESHTYGFLVLGEEGRSSFEIIPLLREALTSNIPDLKVNVRNGGNSEKTANAMGGAGFRIIVSAPEIGEAAEVAETVASFLREDPEVSSAEISVSTDILRLTNRVDLEAAGVLGVVPSDATQTGRIVFNGVDVGEYDDGGEKIPVTVVGDPGNTQREDIFYSIPVKSRSGKIVSLASFSEVKEEKGVSEIPRNNRSPSVTVVAQLVSGNFRGVEERLRARMSVLALPSGVTWETGGTASETIESFRSLLLALAVGIFLVYAVMAIQFERYRQPFIVLSAIPFVLIGVIFSLAVFGSTLSIIAFFGIISLAGVAVNNAIIMIDYTNLLRSRDNLSLKEAIVRGASSRLRPILMTTLTTVLGVLPLAFATGGGAVMAPLGQVILGGLTTSTLITFFITPSLYWLTERRAERRRGTLSLSATPAEEANL